MRIAYSFFWNETLAYKSRTSSSISSRAVWMLLGKSLFFGDWMLSADDPELTNIMAPALLRLDSLFALCCCGEISFCELC